MNFVIGVGVLLGIWVFLVSIILLFIHCATTRKKKPNPPISIPETLRIYVAGPYTPYGKKPHDAIRLAQRNVDQAIKVANAIHDKGHYAFVPHLFHYLHTHASCKEDRGGWYYDYDNTFLDRWANALYIIAPSPGANKEIRRARERGYPIFVNLSQIPNKGEKG